tara:strand:- start:12 stop:620 length:609 start_codon:yes stop_codon:yes gene_type:complete
MNSTRLVLNHKSKLLKIFFSLFIPNNFILLIKNLLAYFFGYTWDNYIIKNNLKYSSLIIKTCNWIKYSQDKVDSGGVGCFELYRWTSGYPEVTGYIIPTFWDCYHYFKDEDLKKRAVLMSDWELKIQRDDGGWEGYYQGNGKPSIIFNSGQVIRGLLRSFKETNDEKYLNAAKDSADWIVSSQDQDGSWTKNNYLILTRHME